MKKAAARKAAVKPKAAPKKAAKSKAAKSRAGIAKAPPKKTPAKKVPAKKVAAKKPAPAVKAARAPKPQKSPLLAIIQTQLDDAKAEAISTIDLDGKAAIADHMVVASGRSSRHVGAIADQLVERLKENGYRDIRVDGFPQCDWVLVDAGDVVVHLFRPEVRSFYNIEKLWSAHAPQERATG